MDLPQNIALYALLLAGVVAGYLLGRKDRTKRRPQKAVIKDYYQGLNFLLGDKPELGVDRFIDAMEVSDVTIDVHLAMASVVRRRGEMDKAIRIHQNLLASPVLNNTNKQLVEMELARDYHAAGLLDRAEKLLEQIAQRKGAQELPALELLLDLYEQERDWQRAIDISSKLTKSSSETRVRVAHFHCEMAEHALTQGMLKKAVACARKARELAPNEARGYWVAAQIEMSLKHHKRVLRYVQKAVELAPQLVSAYLDTYRTTCENMGNDEEYERFLRHSMSLYPDSSLLRALIDFRRKNGRDVADDELVEEIAKAPSFGHLPLLLEIGQRNPEATEVRRQVARIVAMQAGYQCGNCGFTSQSVQWHCPGCRRWGTFGTANKVKEAL